MNFFVLDTGAVINLDYVMEIPNGNTPGNVWIKMFGGSTKCISKKDVALIKRHLSLSAANTGLSGAVHQHVVNAVVRRLY
jgi:hypothetical protein